MEKINRNAPCPCGSGKKYKKCCLGTKKDPMSKDKKYIVKCAVCEKSFDSKMPGTFQSKKKGGKRIYFCPKCNLNLTCSICKKKLGETSFDLFSCRSCGGVTIACEDCITRGEDTEGHY